MTSSRRQLRRGGGFTLVEAIATIVILGTVMTVCSRVISSATAVYTNSATRAELHSELASAMERTMLELRSCRIDPGGNFAPDMTAVRPSGITWTTPDGDRELSLVGSALTLTVGTTECTLANGVTALTVQTYDENNAALATTLDDDECEPVQRIQVTITATRMGVTESLRSRVFLRCVAAGSSAP